MLWQFNVMDRKTIAATNHDLQLTHGPVCPAYVVPQPVPFRDVLEDVYDDINKRFGSRAEE